MRNDLNSKRSSSKKGLNVLLALVAGLMALSLVAAGCPASDSTDVTKAEIPERVPPAPPDFANGKIVYDTYCATCHGENGKGDGPAAAGFDPKPSDFTDRAFVLRHIPNDLVNAIFSSNREMPAFEGVISDQEIWDSFYYSRFFGNDPAILETGEAIYAEKCVTCHGENGDGAGPSAATFNPPPADFTDLEWINNGAREQDLTASIEEGKGQMPAFEDLTPEEVTAVYEFVRSFSYTNAGVMEAPAADAVITEDVDAEATE